MMFEKLLDQSRDYKKTFGSPEGKRVLLDLMNKFNVMHSTYQPGINEVDLAFKEGARNVVLFLIHKLGEDMEKLSEMAKEAQNDRIRTHNPNH